jgi:hypothetical protein
MPRYKGRVSQKAIARDFPHIVEIAAAKTIKTICDGILLKRGPLCRLPPSLVARASIACAEIGTYRAVRGGGRVTLVRSATYAAINHPDFAR